MASLPLEYIFSVTSLMLYTNVGPKNLRLYSTGDPEIVLKISHRYAISVSPTGGCGVTWGIGVKASDSSVEKLRVNLRNTSAPGAPVSPKQHPPVSSGEKSIIHRQKHVRDPPTHSLHSFGLPLKHWSRLYTPRMRFPSQAHDRLYKCSEVIYVSVHTFSVYVLESVRKVAATQR